MAEQGAELELRVRGVLDTVPLIDGHNDLLIHFLAEDHRSFRSVVEYDLSTATAGQSDLSRLRSGRVGGGIFTTAILDPAAPEDGMAASTGVLRELAAFFPDDLAIVHDDVELDAAVADGRIAMLMGLEGGEQIGTDLDTLELIHGYGVRAMTLTWEHSNAIGDSCSDEPMHDGLSAFGKSVVERMNALGMLVDVSHAADRTVEDVLQVSVAPPFASHSGARASCEAARNLPDELLRRIADAGGLVMVPFVPYFVDRAHHAWFIRGEQRWGELQAQPADERARAMAAWERENPEPIAGLEHVAEHIDHVRRVAGIEHVGLGSDFDGMGRYRVTGLEDASRIPALLQHLLERGWSDEDLGKLAGTNFLRFLRDVRAAADA